MLELVISKSDESFPWPSAYIVGDLGKTLRGYTYDIVQLRLNTKDTVNDS